MLKLKCDINQQYLKRVDLHFVKSEHTWGCGSRQRDTTSSGWKFWLNNLAVKGLNSANAEYLMRCNIEPHLLCLLNIISKFSHPETSLFEINRHMYFFTWLHIIPSIHYRSPTGAPGTVYIFIPISEQGNSCSPSTLLFKCVFPLYYSLLVCADRHS